MAKKSDRLEDIWDIKNRPEEVTGEVKVELGPFARLKSRRTVDQRFNALRLSKGPQLFVDWRFVQAGALHWVSKETGEVYSLNSWDIEGPIDATALPVDVPDGIRIVAQKARKSDPFPTDGKAPAPSATIFLHGGRYVSWAGRQSDGMSMLSSEDGWEWRKVGDCTFDMSANPEAPEAGEDAVFVDPSAPEGGRFKMIFRANPRGPEHAEFRRRILEEYARTRPDDIDAVVANYKGKFSAMYGAVSPDGMRWKAIKGPMIIQFSDTRNVVTYNEDIKKYVWYERNNWYYGRRCVGISMSDDFSRFPGPDMLLKPSLYDHPADDWYTNSKTTYPGTRDYHFMFPARYNRATEGCDIIAFSSPEGLLWTRLPEGPVLQTGKFGEWDGGCIFGGLDLVKLGSDSVALPYTGYMYPHKYPRNAHTLKSSVAYALWERERICALQTDGSGLGSFSTYSMRFTGRKLRLNLRTDRSGEVRVEVADIQGKPLQGRSFADADPITGDHFDRVATWKGADDLGRGEDEPIVLRFRLRGAKLFAFEFL